MNEFAGSGIACRRGERLVFANLDFRIAAGRLLTLVGPNGSGKSSLLRLMAALAEPEAGVISWSAAPIADDPDAHRARLHYVGHLDAVKPILTVAENLRFHAALRGTVPDDGRLAAALGAFGLAPLADLPGRFLSQGQRRRTALARLLVSPAPLWLLDEPTLGLDADAQTRLAEILKSHLADGGLAVVATHSPLGLGESTALELGRPQ
jgi:heme exporter protein A